MRELFGAPVGILLTILAIALAIALSVVAALALRNRVLLRLGARNVGRRRGRSALIVAGLTLGTTIIAAALTTGDTMSHTIRSSTISALGQTDEVVSAKGADPALESDFGSATGVAYFDERVARQVATTLRGSRLVDGVLPAIVESVAVQDPVRRQNEPRVTLFATDPARMAAFASIRSTHGRRVALSDLRSGQLYLNEHAADELHARSGDRLLVFAAGRAEPTTMRVRDVVRYEGGGTTESGMLMPLPAAQALLGAPGRIKQVLISNRGDATSGTTHTDAVIARLAPLLGSLGLEADPSKRDAIETADQAGSAFLAFFTTFGSFSIAAGILLIFLIFVMLAAERRGELGIARAIGTRRGHLVELFVFEGVTYDLLAALVGVALGAGIAFGMVAIMAAAFDEQGFDITYAVSARSLLVAYAIGVLLTLAVVALSAWRVSRMTVASAIRNLPESAARGRKRLLIAVSGVLLGILLAVSGAAGSQATQLMLGVSLVLVGAVPVLRIARVPDRVSFTACGVAIVVLWMLPWATWESVFGPLKMDFTTWIVCGMMVVVGAVWTIMFNAAALLALTGRVLGRSRRLAPVVRMAMAYPLAARFRTGVTLAMFTLVVFTLVTGTATSGSFVHAFQDVETFGGGYDVRASTSPGSPIGDLRKSLASSARLHTTDFRAVASQSYLPVDARQVGTDRKLQAYPMRGLDRAFLGHTTFQLGALAYGYDSARAIWDEIARHPGLAVVDSSIVPRRDNFNFAIIPPDFKLTGFAYDDGRLQPTPIEVRDPQTGRRTRLTVIGVLADTAPLEMYGISTSQATISAAFPGRALPTIHYFQLAAGVNPDHAATQLESAFVGNGMEAESIRKVVHDATAASLTFNRLIQGFMGLGLIVGVAALGVISARAVVERRQQIGVLRAIGFRRRMVQAALLLESSFVALTAIVVGCALGLILANNIIDDQRQQASWANLTLHVPWVNLAIIFAVVYLVALGATLVASLRASHVRPAEALRYQ